MPEPIRNEEAVVSTAQGKMRGTRLPGRGERYFNIPYAAAPVGVNRFQPPTAPPAWQGIRDATRPGPTPPQGEVSMPLHRRLASPGWIPGDDYLNLNVWTPDTTGSAPVAVYIYGGAFKEGNGILPFYDSSSFARDGIVAVTFNYRVGAEGFLWLEGGGANLGFQDQVAALEWIRDNIADFGGDPTRVTIFGQSAGGASVSSLLAMPSARGLFRSAINLSGPSTFALSPETARATTEVIAAHLSIVPTAEAFATIDPGTLLAAVLELSGTPAEPLGAGVMLAPVIDGEVLPTSSREALLSGFSADVPLLAGYTGDEMLFFDWEDTREPADEELHAVAAQHSEETHALIERLRSAYPGISNRDLVRQITNHTLFVGPVNAQVEAQTLGGGRAWLYEFAWESRAQGGAPGACHGLELPFVFDILDDSNTHYLTGENPPQALADAMHGAWVSFITDGDPGWPSWDRENRWAQRFDERSALVSDPASTWFSAWEPSLA